MRCLLVFFFLGWTAAFSCFGYRMPLGLVRPAKASATVLDGRLAEAVLLDAGTGYTSPPEVSVTLRSGSGSGAVIRAVLQDGFVGQLVIENRGSYSADATVQVRIADPLEAVLDDPGMTDPVIVLPAGRFEVNTVLNRDVTIQGQGVDLTVVSGARSGSVFKILPGVKVTLQDLTITEGLATEGGGIFNDGGTVKVLRCRILGNEANGWFSGRGGGIYNRGRARLSLVDSTVQDNRSTRWGGGICNSGDGSAQVPGLGPEAWGLIAEYYGALGDMQRFGVSKHWGDLEGPSLETFFQYDYTVMLQDWFNVYKYYLEVLVEAANTVIEGGFDPMDPDEWIDFFSDPDGYIADFGFTPPEVPIPGHETITADDVRAEMKGMMDRVEDAYEVALVRFLLQWTEPPLAGLTAPFAQGTGIDGDTGWLDFEAPVLCITNSIVSGNRTGHPVTIDAYGRTIVGDSSSSHGAGIHNDLGLVLLHGCVVRSNVVSSDHLAQGAGLHNLLGAVRIQDSRFDGNRAESKTAFAAGGAIHSAAGQLEILNSTLRANGATSGVVARGGAIVNSTRGQATLVECRFEENASASGGALANDHAGVLEVDRSTISGNRGRAPFAAWGGGLLNDSGGTAVLRDSTFAENGVSGQAKGGALCNHAEYLLRSARSPANSRVELLNCTLSGNWAEGENLSIPDPVALEGCFYFWFASILGFGANECDASTVRRIPMALSARGGGIFNGASATANATVSVLHGTLSGQIVRGVNPVGGGILGIDNAWEIPGAPSGIAQLGVENSLVAGSTGLDVKFVGGHPLSECRLEGHNVDGDGSLAAVSRRSGGGSVSTAPNPLLGSLGIHGGPTATLPLLPGSPALNSAVPSPDCPTDQRGVSRILGGSPDVGAYESIPPTAEPDAYSVAEQVTLVVGVENGVSRNDLGDALTVESIPGAPQGSLDLHPDGSFTYEPKPGFSGTDTFTYQVTDAAGRTTSASVVVEVRPSLDLLAVHPLPNDTDAPGNSALTVRFDLPPDVVTAAGHLRVRGEQSPLPAFGVSLVDGQLSLDFAKDFHPGERVTVSLLPTLRSEDGAQPRGPFTWQYLTRAERGTGIFQRTQEEAFLFGSAVALGDLDADGDLDAYVGSESGQDSVWINDGSGTFARTQAFRGNSTGVQLGDLDGDGDLDVLVTKAGGYVEYPNRPSLEDRYVPEYHAVLFNDGHGRFQESGQYLRAGTFVDASRRLPFLDFPFGWGSADACLGDLDGDGDLDVLLVNGLSRVNGQGAYATLGHQVWLNNGAGYFLRAPWTFGENLASDAALGDVDGDGDLDVFLVNTQGWASFTGFRSWTVTGPAEVWINDGSGRFGPGQIACGNEHFAEATGVALGDLDGDGDLDAVQAIANQPYAIAPSNRPGQRLWFNDGQGRFTPGTLLGDRPARSVALADLNADGHLDLFFSKDRGGEMWINDGQGRFTVRDQRPGPLPRTVGLGDLDADGDIDAFIVNARLAYFVGGQDDRIEIWLNGNQPTSGDRTFFALEDGGPITIGPTDGLLRNATDADGDVLSVETTHWVEERGTLGYLWRVFGHVETHYEGEWPDGSYVYRHRVPVTAAHGMLGLRADGSFTYAPDPDFSGEDSFEFVVTDGVLASTNTVTLIVNPVNDAPVARDDRYPAGPAAPLVVGEAEGLLANDVDIDGDRLAASVVSGPAFGTLTLQANGSFTYETTESFPGVDHFTYRISDGAAESIARVQLANQPPVAVPERFHPLTVVDGTAVVVAPGVLANDSDPDVANTLAARLVQGAHHGIVELAPDGGFTYTPNPGYTGGDSFRYKASDGYAESPTVKVMLGNTPPRAFADNLYTTLRETPLSIGLDRSVLLNDGDADSDPFRAVLVGSPGHGSVELRPDGTFVYVPSEDFVGLDTFTYQCHDGMDGGPPAIVEVLVVDHFQVVSVHPHPNASDVPVETDLRMVFSRAVEPEALPGRIRIVGSVSGGHEWTASVSEASVSLAVQPGFLPGELVTVTFGDTGRPDVQDGFLWQFRIATARGGARFEAVSLVEDQAAALGVGDFDGDRRIDIVAALDGQVVLFLDEGDGSYSRKPTGLTDGVLVGDFDGDGDLDLLQGGMVGQLALNDGRGGFELRGLPYLYGLLEAGDLDRNGSLDLVRVDYDQVDDEFASRIEIYLNDGTGGFALDRKLITSPARADLALGDVDADGDLDLFLVGLGNDQLWLNDGRARFSRSPQSFGSTFNAAIALGDLDGDGTLDAFMASSDLNGYSSAWFNDGSGRFTRSDQLPFPHLSASSVGLGDLDADGDTDLLLSIDAFYIAGQHLPGTNTVWLNDGSGGFERHPIDPAPAHGGVVALADLDSDGDLDALHSSVGLVLGRNQSLPTARDDFYPFAGTRLQVPASAGLLANDADGDGGSIAASLEIPPKYGTLALGADGSFSFDPRPGFPGADVFTYFAETATPNSVLRSRPARVKIGNTTPIVRADSGYSALNDLPLKVDAGSGILINDSDGEGDPLHAFLASPPAHGVVWLGADGSFVFTANPGYSGSDSFTYLAGDGIATSGPVQVTLQINARLRVVDREPAAFALRASPGGDIVVRWNHDLAPGSIPGNVFVTGSSSGPHACDFAVVQSTLVMDPKAELHAGEQVTVVLRTGLRGTAGEQMSAPLVWQFQVEAPFGAGLLSPDAQVPFAAPISNSWAVALGDFNGDRHLDALVGAFPSFQGSYPNTTVVPGSAAGTVWFNDGSGAFRDSGQRLGDAATYDVAVGDVDGDGDLDAVFARAYAIEVWKNGGAGFLTLGASLGGVQSLCSSVDLADFDADGDLDLCTYDNRGVLVWSNNGAGVFSDTGQRLGPPNLIFMKNGVADLDGDGDLDLLVPERLGWAEDPYCRVWLNDGTGHFSGGQQTPAGDYESVALGDLNEDGACDAVLLTNTGGAEIWLNDGRGHFSPTGQSLGRGYGSDVAVADLNGDGRLDLLAVQVDVSNYSRVWFNEGDGHFEESGIPLGFGNVRYTDLAVGDLNGDQTPDVFLAGAGGPANLVLLNSSSVPSLEGAIGLVIDDESTCRPFADLTFRSAMEVGLTGRIILDHPEQGIFTPASLAASGFVASTDGTYLKSATSSRELQESLARLDFAPVPNRQPVGQAETTRFAILVSDGTTVRTNTGWEVTARSVNDPPMAEPDAGEGFSTTEAAAFVTANALTNDRDPDPSTTLVVVGLDTSGTLGSVVDLGNGTFGYDPDGRFGHLPPNATASDRFRYTVRDPSGAPSVATVTITIRGLNDPPEALPVTLEVEEDGETLVAPRLLRAASDPDDSETASLSIGDLDTTGTRGRVRRVSGEIVTYSPDQAFGNLPAGATAIDHFAYQVQDIHGATAVAEATVIIVGRNDPPVLLDDAVLVDEDAGPLDITSLLLANDVDPDPIGRVPLVIGGLGDSAPAGSVTLIDGIVTYDPNGQFESLPTGGSTIDVFSYFARDAEGSGAYASVVVTITGRNDAPVAGPDALRMNRTDGPVDVTSTLLANDQDVDADEGALLTVVGIDASQASGLVTLSEGVVTYRPRPRADLEFGEAETDVFTYTVADPHGATASGVVTVTVAGDNVPPVASPVSMTVHKNDPPTDITQSLFGGVSDETPGGSLVITSVSAQGTKGTVSLSEGGVVTYDPGAQFGNLPEGRQVTDAFLFTVRDGYGATATAAVRVMVAGSDGPSAQTLPETGMAGSTVTLNALVHPGGADTVAYLEYGPPPGYPLTTSRRSVGSTDSRLSISETVTGLIRGSTYHYRVVASNSFGISSATDRVFVLPPNQPPVARNDLLSRSGTGAVKFRASKLLLNDTDADDDEISVTSLDLVSANGGRITRDGIWWIYEPPASSSPDQFEYRVSDGFEGTASATVTVVVESGPDTPSGGPSGNLCTIIGDGPDRILRFAGIPGLTYRIQYTVSLEPPVWTTVATRVAGPNGLFEYRDVAPPDASRYYRTVSP